MQLDAYLARIGFTRTATVDLATLTALHRQHLLTIPYENLDIHLGRRLTLELPHIFNKIVQQRRGGWCYEMNGLFAWVLAQIGFDVQMLGSRVGGPAQGGDADLDHLILMVTLDNEPWLVDVGFGNGPLEPIPLRAGEYQQGFLHYRLRQEDEQRWFFQNQLQGSMGFTLRPRVFEEFASRCHELQTLPESSFVRATVCHHHTGDVIFTLRGAVLQEVRAQGITQRIVENGEEYAQVLHNHFHLDLAETPVLWEKVWASHLAWQQEMAQATAAI